MDRRDFLDPALLTQSAGHLLGAADAVADGLNQAPPLLEQPLVHFGWRAMATAWEIILPLHTPQANQAARDAFEYLDQLEARLTVYRPSSEVSRLNERAGLGDVPVRRDLFDLLALAQSWYTTTDGGIDITAGALIKVWGFFKGPRRVPTPEQLADALQRSGMHHLHLDPQRQTAGLDRPGVELNLGAVGKGWALDRLVERLQSRWKITTGLLHGGRSSVYGMGRAPGDPRGWCVGLSHPADPAQRLVRVWLRDRALGTSAATFQYLEHEGRRLGHILDPRSGWPAEGVASCSVLAPTSAEADALSTAFFVRGVEAARAYCKEHPAIGMVILPAGEQRLVVVGNVQDCEVTALPGGED